MSLFWTPTAPTRRQREASVVDTTPYTIDSDDYLYRGLGGTPRDLQGSTLRRAQDLSVALYRANPLAHRMVAIYRSYMAGTGFNIACHNPEVQAVVDDFWTSPRNRLDQYGKDDARDWLLFGELFPPLARDAAGNLTAGFIDPSTVTAVGRNPLNNRILDTITVQPAGAQPRTYQVATINNDPAAEQPGIWQGDVCAWLYDRVAASSRGNPFLLPALDWLDAYDKVLWELLERQKALRAHFWDVEVDTDDQLDQARTLWGTTAPRSGSVRFRTPNIRPSIVAPSLGAQEDVAAARYMRQHLAVGGGLAPHWLGSPEDANRSTAEQMDIPVLRSLQDTQADWRARITELVEIAVDAKVAAGYLDPTLPRYDRTGKPATATGADGESQDIQPARRLFTVQLPEVRDAQVQTAAAALASVATAFGQLDLLGAIGPETARMVVRQMLPALGIPPEELPDDEQDLAAEQEQAVAALESYRRYRG